MNRQRGFIKQEKAGWRYWLGVFMILITQAGVFIQFLVLVMMAATFHHTTLTEWGFDIPLLVFFLLVGVIGIVGMFLLWKFVLSGFYSAWNDQWWEHDNPMKIEVEAQREMIKDQGKDIAKIKEALHVD